VRREKERGVSAPFLKLRGKKRKKGEGKVKGGRKKRHVRSYSSLLFLIEVCRRKRGKKGSARGGGEEKGVYGKAISNSFLGA